MQVRKIFFVPCPTFRNNSQKSSKNWDTSLGMMAPIPFSRGCKTIQQHHWKWPTACSFSQAFLSGRWKLPELPKNHLRHVESNLPMLAENSASFVAIAELVDQWILQELDELIERKGRTVSPLTSTSSNNRASASTLRLSRLLTVGFSSSAEWQKRGASSVNLSWPTTIQERLLLMMPFSIPACRFGQG